MRPILMFLPALLLAQAPTPKVAAAKPAAPKPATAKPAVAKKAPAAKPQPAPARALTTDDEKTIYSLGLSLHRSLAQFALSAAEMEIVKRALADGAAGKPAIDFNEYGDRGRPSIPAGAALIFEIELLEIAGGTPR